MTPHTAGMETSNSITFMVLLMSTTHLMSGIKLILFSKLDGFFSPLKAKNGYSCLDTIVMLWVKN